MFLGRSFLKIAKRIDIPAELRLEKTFKKIIKNQPLARFQNSFTEIVVGRASYKIDIFVMILKKHGLQWAWLIFP